MSKMRLVLTSFIAFGLIKTTIGSSQDWFSEIEETQQGISERFSESKSIKSERKNGKIIRTEEFFKNGHRTVKIYEDNVLTSHMLNGVQLVKAGTRKKNTRLATMKKNIGLGTQKKNTGLGSQIKNTGLQNRKNSTDVSCGGHAAISCSSCGPQPSFCNGDCLWNAGKCRKIEIQEVSTQKALTAQISSDAAQVSSDSEPSIHPNTSSAQLQDNADVSCGGHKVSHCSLCGPNKSFCHGDCQWKGGKCTKIEIQREVSPVQAAQVSSDAFQVSSEADQISSEAAQVSSEAAQVSSASDNSATTQVQGCHEEEHGKHGIGYCDVDGFTLGDNDSEKEIFIQSPDYNSTCSNSCKSLHPESTGITVSLKEIYWSGNGMKQRKCWCEFGKPQLNGGNKGFQTCVFRPQQLVEEQVKACSSYTLLSDEWRRIDNSTTVKYLRCDNKNTIINNEWYRFGGAAGTKLPEGASSVFNSTGKRNCASSYLAYVVDSERTVDGAGDRNCDENHFHGHPSFRDGVKRKFICFESAANEGSSYDSCKGSMVLIDVAACKKGFGTLLEEYFVYKLDFRHHLESHVPFSEGCYAYCAVE